MTSLPLLRWRLRDATASAHARLDSTLAPAFDTAAGYAAFLTGMHRFAAATQRATGGGAVAAATVDALRRDLADLDATPAPAPVLPPVTGPAMMGWRYVAAGASLGARVLLPRAHALGFDATRGARYLSAQAAGDAWPALLAELATVAPQDEAAVCAGACTAFAAAEDCLAARLPAVAA